MHPRAVTLIAELGLRPHPEGGFYHELYRSGSGVSPEDGRPLRPALTTIYFLLVEGTCSRWHRVQSDEVWHFYEGDPVDLLVASPACQQVERSALGPLADGQAPVCVVPSGHWQAAVPTGAYALVGCTVGPGFDFRDFALLRDDPDASVRLASLEPAWSRLA